MNRVGYTVILATAAVVLTGCTADDADPGPVDPTPSEVVERGSFGVVEPGSPETDSGPVLCLDGMTEAIPPTCSGPLISDWDWEQAPDHDVWEGDDQTVRWGFYSLEYRVIDDGEVSVDMKSVTVE